MYVGGGLFVRWGGSVGGSVRRAHRSRQAAPPATSTMNGAICWLAPGTDRHLLRCLSTNTQKMELVDGGSLSVTRH